MVGTADSSSNHHSPSSSSPPSQAVDNNTQSRKNLPSPWAQVVRGIETDSSTAGTRQSPPLPSSSPSLPTAAPAPDLPMSDSSAPKASTVSPAVDNSSSGAAPPDASDCGNGNAGPSKRTAAWNKPPNGVAGVVSAASWPTPSETTKAHGKSVAESSSSSKVAAAVDGSQSTTSQGHVTSHAPQRPSTSHSKPSPATNYHMPNRHRSMKRGGGGNIGSGHAQGSFPNPPPPPPLPAFHVYPIPTVSYGNVAPGVSDQSPRDRYRHNNWDSRSLVGGFVPSMNEQRGLSCRGNFGPHPHGNGSYHNNYGSWRDQDRGNYGNGTDACQPRMPPRGLLRHPPPNTTFVGPQPIGPFANQMGFADYYYLPNVPLDNFRDMPLYTQSPPSPVYFPAVEPPTLSNMIASQIEYYFSDDNLVKDEFLRSNMDQHGWVSVTLIADFPRVKNRTSNIQLILDSLRSSTVVEVQGNKLRRHNEWMKWLPATTQRRVDTSTASLGGLPRLPLNRLATDFQSIALEEAIKDEAATEFSGKTQIPNGSDVAVVVATNNN